VVVKERMENTVVPSKEVNVPPPKPPAWFAVRGALLWTLALSILALILVARHHSAHWEALKDGFLNFIEMAGSHVALVIAVAAALAVTMAIAEARRLHRMGKLRGVRLPNLQRRETGPAVM
jgi:hypothetical protein